MVRINPVTHTASKVLCFPRLCNLTPPRHFRCDSAMHECFAGSGTCIFGISNQPASQCNGGPSRRLANIDFPVGISCVRNIKANTRQTVGLVFCPRSPLAKPQPAACNQKTLIAIDIEPLLRRPAVRSFCSLELGR